MKSKLVKGVFLTLALSSTVWAELPDVETLPLNQPSIGERAAENGGPNGIQTWSRKVDALQNEVQELRGLVEEQSHQIQQLSEKQKTLYLDLDKRISKGSAQATSSSGVSLPTQTSHEIADPQMQSPAEMLSIQQQPVLQSEDVSYKRAFELIQAKDYPNAINALEAHLTQYPNGQYTANVYYWLGEVNMVVKNFEQAAVNFHRVLDYYPLHAKAPDSLLKLGYVSYERGNLRESSQFFQDVQNRFPDTSAARLAGAKLQQMRQAGQI